MELQIHDLVESIKKDGIEQAEKEAQAIISAANEKAGKIVADARIEADALKEAAEKEIEIFRESAKVTAFQAKRDAVLAFENEIKAQLKKILSAQVKKTMSSDSLGKLVAAAITGQDFSKLKVEVAEVTDALKAELAKQLEEGLEIKPVKDISAGFRISSKDGSGYFDCTEEEVAEILTAFMSDLTI